ncbi:MAG: hypothetical protein J7L79_01650, partial [Thaumarchaeota archaeon]|nr:hypothetical protein [Nitrososphaerota archaeon]
MSVPKEYQVFGEDYGTSDYKFGPATLGNTPDIIENRGYFPDTRSLLLRMQGFPDTKLLVVGPDVATFVEARRDLAERMVYPMRNGVIDYDDERSWMVVKEVTRYGLLKYFPKEEGFEGFRCVAALSAAAPRYMYERIFELHKEINEEEGRKIVKAVTIIPQPLAVAIAQKAVTCTVLEGGHGNTQIAPISRGVVFNALITLNRGGSDCDLLAAEILRDCGYSDLAKEQKLVKIFKETVGAIPRDVNKILESKSDPRFRAVFRIPNTRIIIDLEKNSWQRFLLGEYFFNPGHEIFQSYYRRGFPKPADTYIEGRAILGTTDIAEVVIEAVSRCSFEVQPMLYRNLILSGGNFAWKVPQNLSDVAVDAPTKLALMLEQKGVSGVKVTLTKNPVYNVWQGCVTYGLFIPDDYTWDWDSREGWL